MASIQGFFRIFAPPLNGGIHHAARNRKEFIHNIMN